MCLSPVLTFSVPTIFILVFLLPHRSCSLVSAGDNRWRLSPAVGYTARRGTVRREFSRADDSFGFAFIAALQTGA